MIYPTAGRNPKYSLKVPDFGGGINAAKSEQDIQDNQAVSMSNMWMKDGTLQTRPALKRASESACFLTANELIDTCVEIKLGSETYSDNDVAEGDAIQHTYKLFFSEDKTFQLYDKESHAFSDIRPSFANTDTEAAFNKGTMEYNFFYTNGFENFQLVLSNGYKKVYCTEVYGYVKMSDATTDGKPVMLLFYVEPYFDGTTVKLRMQGYNAICEIPPEHLPYCPYIVNDYGTVNSTVIEDVNLMTDAVKSTVNVNRDAYKMEASKDQGTWVLANGTFKGFGTTAILDAKKPAEDTAEALAEFKSYGNDESWDRKVIALPLDSEGFTLQSAKVYGRFRFRLIDAKEWTAETLSTHGKFVRQDASCSDEYIGLDADDYDNVYSTTEEAPEACEVVPGTYVGNTNGGSYTAYDVTCIELGRGSNNNFYTKLYTSDDSYYVAETDSNGAQRMAVYDSAGKRKFLYPFATVATYFYPHCIEGNYLVLCVPSESFHVKYPVKKEVPIAVERIQNGDGGYNYRYAYYDKIYWETGTVKGLSEGYIERVEMSFSTYQGEENVAWDKQNQSELITKNPLKVWYGGTNSGYAGGTRLFVAGHPEFKNVIRWSAVNDSSYFLENNFSYVGRDDEAITALNKQDGYLVVFKEHELYSLDYNYSTDETDETIVYFPISPISPYVGCDCPDTIQFISNRLTWLTSEGKVYSLFSENNYSERNVREISKHIENELKKHTKAELKTAKSADYNGNYFVFVGNSVYLWNYDKNPYYNYTSSEKAQESLCWFKWEFPDTVEHVFADGTELTIICRNANGYQGYALDYSSCEDEAISEGGNQKIISKYKSKCWDFGNPFVFKKITRAFFELETQQSGEVKVTYYTENGDGNSPTTLDTRHGGNKGFNTRPHLVRVRSTGFELESDTAVKLYSASITAEIYGEVK